jgi:hypothetical protein
VPGGFEDLVRATSRPAESRSLRSGAEPEPTPAQVEQLKAVVREHGCELLL